MKLFSLLMGSIVLAVIGQLSLKTGVASVAGSLAPMTLIPRALTTPLVWLGFAAYGISSLLWLLVLSRTQLSYAYPMGAFGYVLAVAASAILLREDVSMIRWLAVLIIAGGLALLARN